MGRLAGRRPGAPPPHPPQRSGRAPSRGWRRTAAAAGAGLVVLGATAAGPLAAELLGSTADRVLRQAACPVLVVRGEPRIPPARVLVPVDLSELSGDAFRCGLDLLAQLAPGGRTEVRAAYALGVLDAAGLVMLGTHGRGGLDRLILGSVAATVARRAPASVLMVPPEAALGEGIAESILARTTPAWHPEAAHPAS